MHLDELFPSPYVRASDLHGKRVRATIAEVGTETVGRGRDAELKVKITFAESSLKPLLLNKTNGIRIAELVGSRDTDTWPGAVITLVPTTTEFQGKVVPCIRIDAALPGKPVKKLPPVKKVNPATATAPVDDIDEAMKTVEY